MRSRRFSGAAFPFAGLAVALGCQGILGIEDPVRRAGDSSGGSSNSGGNDGTGGANETGGRPSGGTDGSVGGAGGSSGGASGDGNGGAGDGGDGSGGAGVDSGPPPDAAVTINEVESNAGTPGDWVELYNSGTTAVDLSGYVFSDGSEGNTYRIPSGTVIEPGGFVVLEEPDFDFGLGSNDSAFLLRPNGTTVVTSFTWSSHALATFGACPDGSGELTANATATKGATNDCTPYVIINEVESENGIPGDWVELYNSTLIPADVSGWIFRDNDDAHGYAIPQGTIIPPGRFLVLDEAALGFGLAGTDAARLFLPDGKSIVNSHQWTSHAAVTYGRCPVAGPFVTTSASTKNGPNACTGQPNLAVWPGGQGTASADGLNELGDNVSSLFYEAAAAQADDVIWAVRNAPAELIRLKRTGTKWAFASDLGWTSGKTLRYPQGGGDPDAEGVTRTDLSGAEVYVAAERDNEQGQTSRFSVLRYDTTSPTNFLIATQEWNLTADLPLAEANRGLEGIAWLPDAYLTAKGFHDELKGKPYDPADYTDHGAGLFVVAVESTGMLYVFALDHTSALAQRVATISTGQPNVNDVQLDRDVGYLWAYCGASCTNVATILDIDTTAASATLGRFVVRTTLQAPTSLVSFTNEGITFAPASRCAASMRPFYWADDEVSGGHSLFEGTIPCGAFLP